MEIQSTVGFCFCTAELNLQAHPLFWCRSTERWPHRKTRATLTPGFICPFTSRCALRTKQAMTPQSELTVFLLQNWGAFFLNITQIWSHYAVATRRRFHPKHSRVLLLVVYSQSNVPRCWYKPESVSNLLLFLKIHLQKLKPVFCAIQADFKLCCAAGHM